MPNIRVLPTHLVNKIAAGEVIERPASVVKELIENALDAGTTRIDVTVEDGGRRLMQVTDDGGGMGADDLARAFLPHATSKIAAEDDLSHIATMGFRGEALASIASVSHARIQSRRREDDSGFVIEASGGEISEVRPCAAAPGTTVTIRDLFFNTPARRKFMRTTNTELGHVVEQVARLALPHPEVAFTLTHNGREVKNLPAAETTVQRAGAVFGRELADCLLPLIRRGGAIDVSGLIAPPAAARGTSKWQYYFLNGRYIRDRLLGHAVREAFRGRIDPSRWPVALVFLELDPAAVDVNVHPTKIEVRFQNSQLVHGEVLAALTETLNRAELNPDAVVQPRGPLPLPAQTGEAAPAGEGPALDGDDEQRRQSLRQALADFFKSAPPPQPRLSFPETHASRTSATVRDSSPPRPEAPATGSIVDRALSVGGPVGGPGEGPAGSGMPAPPGDRPGEPAPPAARAIQIHNSYIVAAVEDGLVIIDQHALHERLIYNELRGRLARGRLAGQRLLIPATFPVTPTEADRLSTFAALLSRVGIEVAPFGPDTMAVQQFPTLLSERDVAPIPFVREVLDQLAEDETTDPERLLAGVLEVMACQAAVKAGDPLGPAEIESLLARARDAEKGSACPHGRPTTLKMTLRDLEKQFRRT